MPLRSPAAKPASREDSKGTVQRLSDGSLTARAYCESCLARIHASEGRVRAWIALDDERALTIAATRDAERAQGGHALHGVPVGVKDVYDTDDLPTEMGSPAFVGNQPGKNAELVARILAAGGYAQSLEPQAHAGRFLLRIGRGRCGGPCSGRRGHADQRFGDPARGVLRSDRLQAEPGQPADTRRASFCRNPGPSGSVCAHGRRRRLLRRRPRGVRYVRPRDRGALASAENRRLAALSLERGGAGRSAASASEPETSRRRRNGIEN